MRNVDKVIDTFVNGDYFLIFLVLTIMILVVLVLALIKSKGDYNALLSMDNYKRKDIVDDFSLLDDKIQEEKDNSDELLGELSNLMAETKEDMFDENVPLVKQIDLDSVKSYEDLIDEYENSEEENAVISSEELERRTKERMEALGMTDNQAVIQKYEEDQENKAIISYEQLLKNASNISLSYIEEKTDKDAPKVSKVEVEQKEVTGAVSYLEEEEFLKILKEFRTSL